MAIHPTAFVGPDVVLGDDARIGPNAVILGPARIGNGVWIGPGAVIGGPPEISSLRQNAAWDADPAYEGVVIGDDVVIRENVTISQGSHRPTTIGTGAWLLTASYVAHDVLVGAGATISAGVRLGGHCVVGDLANLGMNATVHQRRFIGGGAMVGMGAIVARDVPPFAKVYGSPLRLHGVNSYVLAKMEASTATGDAIARALLEPSLSLDDLTEDPVVGEIVAQWLARPDAGRAPVRSAPA